MMKTETRMGRPRKFVKTTTFGFDLDVSMKNKIEEIAKEISLDEGRKYSKGDCIRLALQYWIDSGYPTKSSTKKRSAKNV